MKLCCLYAIGDQVHIDDAKDVSVIICSVRFRYATAKALAIMYEISWFHNGVIHTEWVEEWRLTPWEE